MGINASAGGPSRALISAKCDAQPESPAKRIKPAAVFSAKPPHSVRQRSHGVRAAKCCAGVQTTSSSGVAWSLGRCDGGLDRQAVLDHLRDMVAATDLPVNADFESGFAADPQGVAESVRLAIETGVAGLSIEDATGDAANPLHDIDTAVARLRAARVAIDQSGTETLLVGRAENFFAGRPMASGNRLEGTG